MTFEKSTLDDLMQEVFQQLMKQEFNLYSSRSNNDNPTSELVGCTLKLTNPRARLSISETRGKPFSALGELFWYLSGSQSVEVMEYYIPSIRKHQKDIDGDKILSAYGPRLLNLNNSINQIHNVIELLTNNPNSRRAVIQIFDGEDIGKPEVPCTCLMQFLIRNGKLSMLTYMRSNDAYKGLIHDVFSFTMIQEIICNSLGCELGDYYHFVGSLHLYKSDVEYVRKYFKEGYQSSKFSMPPMPPDQLWEQIELIMGIVEKIRLGHEVSFDNVLPYWADLGRLLKVYNCDRNNKREMIGPILNEMNSANYKSFIENKIFKDLK